jgi:hypothetical protein
MNKDEQKRTVDDQLREAIAVRDNVLLNLREKIEALPVRHYGGVQFIDIDDVYKLIDGMKS